ncbi:MAG: tripartite tricarboxylate transporter substrate binding protein [Betaproteobacteria bacterium]|nr:tripartite tricarboxylate transporter substrate binding protein [Betaproteobacteria bacterium]
MPTRLFAWMLLLTTMAPGTSAAAQPYPAKPIRILASQPGAQVDFVARRIAPDLAERLGQPVVVDNRPGYIAVDIAAKAQPDGYTLAIYASSVWISVFLQKMPFDPVKDLAPITLATNAPLFLFTHPSLPVATVKDLIALAKARPGELNYGSSSTGTSNHLAGLLFKRMSGVDIVRIPYKGTGQAAMALVANQVQMIFGSAAAGMPQVKAGRLRVLGVGSSHRSLLAPEVPTISESGLPGYEAASLSCMWAPAGTPRAIITRLSREILRILNGTDTKEKFLRAGLETLATTPEQTAAYIKADMAKWEKIIKEKAIHSD